MPRDDSTISTKSSRIPELRDRLMGRWMSVQELSHDFALSARTIQRYLREMQGLEQDCSHPPKYRVGTSADLDPVEALITHSAVRMLYHHAPGYNPVYLRTLEKLAWKIYEPVQGILKASTSDLKSRVIDRLDEGDALSKIASAWLGGSVIDFMYLSTSGSGQLRRNELEVYFVEVSRSNLGMYVIGYERGFHHKMRTYKINRMSQVRVLNEKYKIPADFDPKNYLSNAWGVVGKTGGPPVEVVVQFGPSEIYRVKELVFPGLTIDWHEDKSAVVRFKVGTDTHGFPIELLSWVQGWGSRIDVLAPQDLRERWLQEAQQVASRSSPVHNTPPVHLENSTGGKPTKQPKF